MKGEVPPGQETVMVTDRPMSVALAEGVSAGAPNAGLTVTVADAEATDTDALSLTWNSKLHTPVVRLPVETEGSEPTEQLKEPPNEP